MRGDASQQQAGRSRGMRAPGPAACDRKISTLCLIRPTEDDDDDDVGEPSSSGSGGAAGSLWRAVRLRGDRLAALLGISSLLLLLSLACLLLGPPEEPRTAADPGPGVRTLSSPARGIKPQASPPSGCTVTDTQWCEVTCTNVVYPAAPAVAAAQACTSRSVYMIFENCEFPERRLEKGWMNASYLSPARITGIRIRDGDVKLIDDDTFEDFEDLQTLEIATTSVTELKKGWCATLKVNTLEIKKLNLEWVESGILPAELKTLSTESTNINEEMLSNITGTNVRTSIENAYFTYSNRLTSLKSNYLRALSNVKELSFQFSSIDNIESGTFDELLSLQKLILSYTRLTTLEKDAIPNIPFLVYEGKFFKIYLGNNNWNCDCNLAWLATQIRTLPEEYFGDNVTCAKPQRTMLKDIDFSYCKPTTTPGTEIPVTTDRTPNTTAPPTSTPSIIEPTATTSTTPVPHTTFSSPTTPLDSLSTTGLPTVVPPQPPWTSGAPTTSTTTTTTTTTTKTIETPQDVSDCVEANRTTIIYSTRDKRKVPFPKTDDHFEIKEEIASTLKVTIGNNENLTIVWRKEGDKNCFRHAVSSYTVDLVNLEPGATYVVCLLVGGEYDASPFNCRAHSLLPAYADQAWILNRSKPLAIGTTAMTTLATGAIFAGVAFALVYRFPQILRRNKRVIVVKHKPAKVLILPAECKQPPSLRPPRAAGALETLFPPRTTLTSEMSQSNRSAAGTPRSSTTTYVSVTEPSEEELWIWRLEKTIERFKARESADQSQAGAEGRSGPGSGTGHEPGPGPGPGPGLGTVRPPPSPPGRVSSISWRLDTSTA